jgi:tungstate transport system ATP-binding protein
MQEKRIYRLRGIRKRYDRAWSLDLDSLDILEGEILGIVGPNGSGKSTLLKLLHFLDEPDQGSIEYRGALMDYPVPPALMRSVTMVFQKPIMFRGSVFRNISFGQRLQRMLDPKGLERLMEQLDLTHLKDASAREISGGERQRVALARALALNTDILLLDEPAANLDPGNVILIESIIKRLQETRKTTIVLVTHNIAQARRLADRVAFIFDGCLVEVGGADAFLRDPSDPRSKAYIRQESPF